MSELWGTVTEVGNAIGLSFGDGSSGLLQKLAREAVEFIQILDVGAKNLKAMADGFNALVHGDFKGVVGAFKESSAGQTLANGPSDPMRAALSRFVPSSLIPGGPATPDAQAPYVGRQASVPAPMGIGGSGGGQDRQVVIQQTNSTSVEVHTTSDSPRAIGDAVGAGVATAQQRANDRAHTALRKP
jgi:hypothetical protein